MPARIMTSKAFQSRFGSKLPIVCPPMAGVAGGRLAAAVHKAGGFGYIGAGHKPFDTLVEDVRLAKETLSLSPNDDLPVGVGFMGWKFEPPQLEKETGINDGERWLAYIIHEAKARSVWISFANDLKAWVDRARAIEKAGSNGASTRKEKLLIAIMVHSAAKAKEALSWKNVDAVVLQGTEAGGHGADSEHGAPLDELLDAVLGDTSMSSDSRPLILAAGGISSPAAVAKYLGREGVAAVVPGTALCVADESTLSDPQKKLLVDAQDGASGTARSVRWDIARGTTGWPVGVDGRGLRDAVSESSGEVQKGGPPVTWAGTGVGDVTKTGPVADILQHLASEYRGETEAGV
ncbi:hypothetical protein BMF94_4739 [Rhodotorula taiwanensis]|uniref:Uncharacterized protein n=1 Tax=Rhodotorula taiwanensis TaxID=741276 RepID=A0A2S5B619_9BASI|nr:hypothetical protein BMF94_4739 [Rhodotorula taiwanensis]